MKNNNVNRRDFLTSSVMAGAAFSMEGTLLAKSTSLLKQETETKGSPSSPNLNWHENAFFGIHGDIHASAWDTDLGRDLTPEMLRSRLLLARPDWIQTDCKGHPGYTSWPAKIGSTAPGVVKDSLRIYRDVTREMGIKLGVYYSGAWDWRAIELHPGWAAVDAEGQSDKRATCRLHGYDEQLMIPQMMEVIDTYDVDGFWVDGENLIAVPCWCELCRAEFTRRTGIAEIPTKAGQPHWAEWMAFHRDLFVEHVTKYTNAVHARKPGCLSMSNLMYSMGEPEAVKAPVDYLSADITATWGAETAAVQGRIYDAREMSWDLMFWGFTQAASDAPWVFKPIVQMEQELSEPLALGGAVMLNERPQRSGWLTEWHWKIMARAAEFCRARKETCFQSKTVPQAAVIQLPEHYYAFNKPLYGFTDEAVGPLRGAMQALLETHHSTDVLPEDAALKRMGQYKLLVIPEQTRLSASLVGALEDYARSGGYVLITGTHLSRDYPAFTGTSPRGEAQNLVYLPLGERAVPVGPVPPLVNLEGTRPGVKPLDSEFGLAWQPVSPSSGTKVIFRLLTEQDPARNGTDLAVGTRRDLGRGAIIAVHGPLFLNYYHYHAPSLREFIGDFVAGLGIPWAVTVDGPPRLEMILRQKEGKLMVNLINRGTGEPLSEGRVTIEELPPIENVVVRVRRETAPKSVTIVPPDAKFQSSYKDGVVTISVPQVDIHRVLVIE